MLPRTDNMRLERRTPTVAPLFCWINGISRKMHRELSEGGKRVREETFGERPTRSNGWYGTGLWAVGGNGQREIEVRIYSQARGHAAFTVVIRRTFDLILISVPGLLWQAGRGGFDKGHSVWPSRRWRYGEIR
ncbi:hypothetical protein BDP55DRAFT_386007 [Colletotrichum godetiae]|uniref:Uncharacterized protein n=1 Tax=Colletotrichum godetiae TaxID=1209918 RepID=A0AAJ0ATC4_9PEZI|nr:uncharacterized protein BDP55DRAFT_386007 [Colletotrichum godetiae]KAK1689992.1 hypothetical protein BDP55DRAFT_386007 [Colletotrichum godetiae]